MKPVNLLPAGDRARRRVAAVPNGSYMVLGVLAVLLIAAVAYVSTTNSISSSKAGIAKAQQETQEAEARIQRLGAFGNFADIKATRLASVTGLASARFDWERLMRELGLVLPEDVFITEADASATGTAEGADPTATGAAPGGPTLNLVGCAKSQTDVAKVMVRLRNLHRALDVTLAESAEPEDDTSGTAGVVDQASGGAAGCGSDFKFDLTVVFSPVPPVAVEGSKDDSVPATLGGGA